MANNYFNISFHWLDENHKFSKMSADTGNNQATRIKQQIIAFCIPGGSNDNNHQWLGSSPQNTCTIRVTILGKPDLWLCGIIGFKDFLLLCLLRMRMKPSKARLICILKFHCVLFSFRGFLLQKSFINSIRHDPVGPYKLG